MTEYECNSCGMGVKGLTCRCGKQLVDSTITTSEGKKVRVAECPEGCGKIKSPTCCGHDMTAMK